MKGWRKPSRKGSQGTEKQSSLVSGNSRLGELNPKLYVFGHIARM